ncbi:LPS-assembly protein LptD [Massilia sp. IC2-477]|uniref:LPS-assembly protein LptD n=1 Tax=unclassified Massilia TaxID=2609279 RepID=UPI001D12309D|nr:MULTISPECIES: LPS-assembly protein LptD [unclassified Massilia]MCC2957988.1 LPS-assembly protein LptD [Massilia sp. IC2-477]MCC2973451.1 LPS-assembly protein LptD [Massilia sp. IC2-476]
MSWFSAHPFPPRQARALYVLASAAIATSAPLYAQTVPPAPHPNEQDLPITIRAEDISGRPDRQLNLERNVELTRGQTRLSSDTACYMVVEDQVTAVGNVNMWRFGDRYKGDELQLNLETGKGYVLRPEYRLQLNNAQGNASRIDFLGEDVALVRDGTYSTCDGPDPDWYLKSSTLRLDSGRDVGLAGKTVIYFKDVPILGTPALSFSLSGARRSGWLAPTMGFGAKGKAEVMVPYYFNIAPNRDLTVFPRLMLDRGLQLGATGRYLGVTERGAYNGETHIEGLRHDRETGEDRWRVDSVHTQSLAPNWSYGWNLHAASDDEYPSDFSRTVAVSAERQLLREVRTDVVGQYWSLSARAQNYQVLQDPAATPTNGLTVPRPYDRLPQINFHAGRFDVKGFDWAFDAEAVSFWHPEWVRGNRAVAVAQVSYPIVRPGWFVTPKVISHHTRYDLDRTMGRNTYAGPTNLSRSLNTFSLDSGMIFERDASLFGRAVTQTLEPRLFYVKTPYKDQSQFPIFDTGRAGFNYAQLFSENRYVGADRVSDANQLTAAVVSRFIQPDGAERLRMAFGQRIYFDEPRVRLPGEPVHQSRSDVLLAASGRISETWSFDSGVQYDATGSNLYSSNLSMQWQPARMKVVNAEYRYQRDSFRNVDLSAQWPLSARWYGVGRVSYALRSYGVGGATPVGKGKLLESLIGLEYKADCWVFRFGAQRFVTAAQTTSTPIFFQLELNGLSRLGLGSNPLEAFSKGVPGYTQLNTNVGRP